MEANKIQVVDDQGNEIEFEVLFTFDSEENGKKYVLYYDPNQEETSVFASVYDDEGNLFEIESPEEWEMVEEVFQSFMADEEESEEETCCGGKHHDEDHECCGGKHHDEDHECCGGKHHGEGHECCGHGDCEN